METVILVVHILLAVALIGIILIQRSEGGGLGLGGQSSSGAGMSGLMSARGAANALTRTTAFLAAGFMVTSIILAIIAGLGNDRGSSILDQAPAAATPAPAAPENTAPQAPANPAAPLSQ